MQLRSALIAMLSLGLTLPATAVVTQIDIDKLISRAVVQHPTVRSAVAESEATEFGVTAARLERFPTPSVGTTYDADGVSGVISIQQPLWTGGRIAATIDQAEYDDKAAEAFIGEQQVEIAKQTVDIWRQYIEATGLINVYRNDLSKLDTFASMMRRRVNAGVSARIELDLVSNRILQTEKQIEGAQEQRKIAIARLEQVIGEPIDISAIANTSANNRIQVMAVQQSAMIERMAFDEASINNPAVVKNSYQIEAAKAEARVRDAGKKMNVYVRALYEHNFETDEDDTSAYLGVQYDPGAGFSNFPLTEASQARVKSLEASKESARRVVMEDLQTLYQQYISAKNNIDSLKAAAAGAQIVLDSYKRQFIAGRKSWLDVLNAVRELTGYQAELVQTQSTLVASFYKLQIGLGLQDWQEQIYYEKDTEQYQYQPERRLATSPLSTAYN